MRTRLLVAATLLSVGAAFAKPPIDTHAVGQRLVAKLMARKARPAPRSIDTTDFSGDNIGCITLTRSEMRDLDYPGHAFLCEEGGQGEVLGAVLGRNGRVLCYVSGDYAGDACYDLTICDLKDTLCVR